MFGRKSKKREQRIEEKQPEEEQVVDPYDDEPEEWQQLTDADRARKWYELESLTIGSAPSPSLSDNQENPFSAYYDEAHRGNRCAEYALGEIYLTGTLTQQDTFQAGLWFSQASDLGSPFACYELAKMMNLGIGFGKDPASAEQFYQKAYQSMLEIEARSPHPSTEKKLAVICENGLCPNADPSAASRWRQLALGISPFVETDVVEAETTPAPNDQKRVRKSADLPGVPEFSKEGPASALEEKPDPMKAETGLASNDQNRVRKSMNFPGTPESLEKGPGSGFDDKTNAVKAETEPASYAREIPVEYIFPAKDNPYAINDTDEALYALAMSIQINGLLNPLVLHKISDTEYRIISGEKRYTAITRYLHWNTISATVKEHLSANAARLMLHAANLDVREYTSAQKLKFYMDAEKLLQRMKESGEYSGPLQKGIADLLGMSEHQVHKYQKIAEALPRRQLNKFKKGEISLKKAYELARAAPVKQDETETKTGPASNDQNRVRKSADFPGAPESSEAGPASALEEKPDSIKAETGPASECEKHVPKSEVLPGAAELPDDGPASALDEKPDAIQAETGRASLLKMDAVQTEYEDPETYQEAISLLARLPTAPGDTCAVRNGEEIVIGTVDRMEVYRDALLISVLIDGIRRPYPVSLIGTELFIGQDCYRLAEAGQNASSF